MIISKNELKVLEQLFENCRESRNIIAKKCNLSRSGIDKIINKFLKMQIINYKTIVDYNKLGMNYYKILINLTNLNFDKTKIEKSINNVKIVNFFSLEGNWDMEIIVATSEIKDLQNEILNLKEKFNLDIEKIKIIIISNISQNFPNFLKSQSIFSKNNFLSKSSNLELKLKDSHYKLIDLLIKDPITPLYNLDFISFEKAKKDLQDLKDIIKFSIEIDYEKINLIQRKFFISFNNFSSLKNCEKFIKSHSPIFFSNTIDEFDFCFDMVFNNALEETSFLKKLKEYHLQELVILKSHFILN